MPGVWGLIALSLYGVALRGPGWGLIPVYSVLVNAWVHGVHAIVLRRYNPGLVTALVIFLPLGGYSIRTLQLAGAGSPGDHAVGLLISVLIRPRGDPAACSPPPGARKAPRASGIELKRPSWPRPAANERRTPAAR